MKKQYAVIGLGKFGSSVARNLIEHRQSVIAIDSDEAKVKNVAEFASHALVLDAMDERALKDAGIQNVDVAIVSIGENIEANILVVMLLKELGIKNIVAKAVTELHGKVLASLGVQKVIHPERDMAQRVAYNLVMPNFLDHIELSAEYSIAELPTPPSFEGQSLQQCNLRAAYGINVIAIKSGPRWNVNPAPTDTIVKGDILVVLGSNANIEKIYALSSRK